MQEIVLEIEDWMSQGKSVALATVIRTWGSSPRGMGAKMAVTEQGEMAGSVSGGCVEGAVVEAGMECLKTGIPRLLHFGVSDKTAWDVGLACGGEIDVFVRLLDAILLDAMRKEWDTERPIIDVVVIKGSADLFGSEFLVLDDVLVMGKIARSHKEKLTKIAEHIQNVGNPHLMELGIDPKGTLEIFVDVIQPPPTLVIVGGVHIAIPLETLARTLGYKTILIDPRKKFGNRERFPHADQVINFWPEAAFKNIHLTSSSAVAVLTHDPKIDDPALKAVLPSSAFYVGALGSKKTQSDRRQRLIGMGLSTQEIDRLHGPIGLDFGGSSPEEIALGIMAEIVQIRHQGSA